MIVELILMVLSLPLSLLFLGLYIPTIIEMSTFFGLGYSAPKEGSPTGVFAYLRRGVESHHSTPSLEKKSLNP